MQRGLLPAGEGSGGGVQEAKGSGGALEHQTPRPHHLLPPASKQETASSRGGDIVSDPNHASPGQTQENLYCSDFDVGVALPP